jgi:hypothetical protein
MHAPAVLPQPSRTLVITAAAVPLALAVLADDVRVRRQLQAARRDPAPDSYPPEDGDSTF